MFTPDSRYANIATVETKTARGKVIVALKMRRLPATPGQPHMVIQNDQLDRMSLDAYGNADWYWHIADANTELDSRALLRETGRTILVPEK